MVRESPVAGEIVYIDVRRQDDDGLALLPFGDFVERAIVVFGRLAGVLQGVIHCCLTVVSNLFAEEGNDGIFILTWIQAGGHRQGWLHVVVVG